ncbi:MAG: TonB-dependent receptor [Bacteroidota bacterium]
MTNKCCILICIFLLDTLVSFAQTDSLQLKEVTVSAYLQEKPVLRLPSSVSIIDSSDMYRNHGQSLVPVLNTAPGVRMEERSPGSYRISIRGSLIRSPFGIRNTKIYLDEFPLTNAGGEAYLNLIDLNSLDHIEVLKGPDGSLFGANSGGVIRLVTTNSKKNNQVNIGVGAGAFGLFQQNIGVQQKIGKNIFTIHEGWQRSDGYRENSAMDRKFAQLTNQYNYSEKANIRFLFFYSDLNYQTPGGLTLEQMKRDPQMARPGSAFIPGATQQQAGIRNRTYYGGILHEVQISPRIKQVIGVFGSHTLFENPFITNYEIRNENNTGARTWFEFRNKNNAGVQVTLNVGAEGQIMESHISNYGNNKGIRDTVQAIDEVRATQGFVFTRFVADFFNKWIIEASVSYNDNQYMFERQAPVQTSVYKNSLVPQFMPRLAASYLISKTVSLRAIVSRGYSPPTVHEIRSSDNTINTSLKPESGWNYEVGFRVSSKNRKVWWDASVFYYELSNAIVKRINNAGQDYFVNAGGTYQPGFESQFNYQLLKQNKENGMPGVLLTNAYTYQGFKFINYKNGTLDFSGNHVTGIPPHISVTGITMEFPLNFYLFVQYNYTARIPLNDANTVYAEEYHLVQAKMGWKFYNKSRFVMDICIGADNMLDQRYSLGNDLNALGGRYYNPAPGVNYFGKVNLWF